MTDALDASSEPNGLELPSIKLVMDVDAPVDVALDEVLEKSATVEAKPTLESLFDDEPPRPRSPGSPPRSRTGSYSVRFDLPDDEAGPSSPRSRSSSPYASRESTPNGTVKRARGRSRAKTESPAPTLVPDLPLAWDEALETFETLDRCVYERKDLGLSREQDEMMVCDCTYDPGEYFPFPSLPTPLRIPPPLQHTFPACTLYGTPHIAPASVCGTLVWWGRGAGIRGSVMPPVRDLVSF